MRGSIALPMSMLAMSCCLAESSLETHREESPQGSVIVEWNQLAYKIAFAEDQFRTFKGQRALAMMHLAQHDALNSITRRFEPYAAQGRRGSEAEPTAAAAQAARQVLIAQYPAAQSEIDALLAQQLASVAGDMRRKNLGIDLGRAAATAILELRNKDGWEVEGEYEFVMAPGVYQSTPPWQGFALHPGLARAKPFMLKAAAQVRPPAPPSLASRAYARALEEVKKFGALASSARTNDQTAYAVWWMEFSEGLVNRFARRLANERKLELWEAARLFALMNAALVDTYVAVWDSKYVFNHWRPYTAIRQAANDGNSWTQPDLQWESLRPAPPFPEYVSAHAAGCACTFAILAREFGRNMSLTLDSLTAPPGMPTRSFKSFRAAADECADSRVRLGFNFRYSTDDGQ
ncbi:MAG: phosphatase PAP2 family protein, partial [Lysobacterales bacterium]